MAKLSDAKSVKIGVKFDQPGLGYKKPRHRHPGGLRHRDRQDRRGEARHPARQGRVGRDRVEEPRAVPPERHRRHGRRVVLDHRRAPRPSARPVRTTSTGQDLLVRKDDDSITGPDTLTGKKVCSVTGSTSIKTVQEKYKRGAGAVRDVHRVRAAAAEQLGRRGHHRRLDPARVRGAAAATSSRSSASRSARSGTASASRRTTPRSARSSTTRSTARSPTAAWQKAYEDTLGKGGGETPAKPALDSCS